MAKFNIPDPDETDEIMDLVVNAADRARISGLEFAAELSEDVAESHEHRMALLAFKYGDDQSDDAAADLVKDARTAAAIHRQRAEALKAEAEVTRRSLYGEIDPAKEKKRPKKTERVEIEIAVRRAGAAARGAHVALMAEGRDIASARVDDKGVARFALEPGMLSERPGRGFRVTGFRTAGQPEPPSEGFLQAEVRSEDGGVLRRTVLRPDLGQGRAARKHRIELDGEEPVPARK
jgi:hypothetical protein